VKTTLLVISFFLLTAFTVNPDKSVLLSKEEVAAIIVENNTLIKLNTEQQAEIDDLVKALRAARSTICI
jgi:hypothetical protein